MQRIHKKIMKVTAFLLAAFGKFSYAQVGMFFTASGGGQSFTSSTLPNTDSSSSTNSLTNNVVIPDGTNSYYSKVDAGVGSSNLPVFKLYYNSRSPAPVKQLNTRDPKQARGPSTLSSPTEKNITSQLAADASLMSSEIDDDVQEFAFEAENSQSAIDLASFTDEAAIDAPNITVKNSTGIFVASCTDRSFWDAYAIPSFFVEAAEYFLVNPMPVWNDSAYLMYNKTGDRLIGQAMLWSRQVRLPYLVLAECKFNNGTFLNTIESDLVSLATQRSWAYPAADGTLEYYNGTRYFMDLSSASIAENLGLALYLMGDLLNSTTKNVVTDALYTRVFNPLKMSFQGNSTWQWWVSSSANQNGVIWAGVMVAVFSVLEDADDRRFFANKAILYSKNYLNGFMSDGYASEGVGYWNYGFLNYALLRQTLYDGTAGIYDAFANPKASQSALFAKEFGMNYGNAANFGDCHFDVFFDSGIVRIIDLSFLDVVQEAAFQVPNRAAGLNLAYYLPSLVLQNTPVVSGVTTTGMNALRRYYNVSGVLVVRPDTLNDGQGLAGTFKLGGNQGGHSHNDIGSYVISVNSVKLTGDVGGPLYYDINTFNANRYRSPLMNSFGHPVPVVNGRLQSEANYVLRRKAVHVSSTSFTNDTDSILFNLAGAYAEPYLQSLTRNTVHSRSASTITITDTVSFSKACTFEDALITLKNWTFTSNSTGYFSDDSSSEVLHVEVSSDIPFFMNTTILSSYNVTFTRIGIYLLGPVTSATVSVLFYPG